MADFERALTVNVPPDEAFQFLADPANLPKYVARMSVARPEGGQTLHVAADVQGRHEEGHAHFHADAAQRKVEWGAPGEGGYRGWLQVIQTGDGSTVTIYLYVPHDEDTAETDRVLDETVSNIESLLVRR